MRLIALPYDLSVCKYSAVPAPLGGFYSLSCVEGEISLVCESDKVPQEAIAREDGWRAFRVEGQLDFSLVGVLAGISQTLAEAGIPLFALSTYNTDYILVKKEYFDKAKRAFRSSDYDVVS